MSYFRRAQEWRQDDTNSTARRVTRLTRSATIVRHRTTRYRSTFFTSEQCCHSIKQLSNKACLSWSIHARHPFQLSDDTSIGHHSVFRKLTVQKSALTRLRLQDSRRRPCRLTQNCLCDKALQIPSSIKPTTQMACGTSLQRKTARFSRSPNDVPLSSVHILSTYRISPRLKAKLGEAPRCVHQQQASKTEASYPSLFLCHRINRLVLLRRLS